MFKDVYKTALGDKAAQYQTVGFLVSSACAEVIADVLLCPFEAVSNTNPVCELVQDEFRLNLLLIEMILTASFSFLLIVEGPHADL